MQLLLETPAKRFSPIPCSFSVNKMSEKRAHKTLSLDEKLQIFEKLGSHTHRQLSEEYGVGVSTIADIKKKGSKLREHKHKLTEMGCRRPVKTMKIGNDDQLEMTLFSWFKQKREEGFPITGKHYINLIAYFDLVCWTNIQWLAC